MLLELPLRLLIALLLILPAAACDRQKAESPQAEQPETAQLPLPDAKSGKLDRRRKGQPAPDVQFLDPDGEKVGLTAFEGKPLLLNLWATWCAPCVAEMPTLDRLAQQKSLQVLAVSQDIAGQEAKVAAFFKNRKLSKLEPYQDPDMALMTALQAEVLPATILYDAEGREVWRMTGAADWTGSEAASLLKEAVQ
jgi:thiol-disulfide isomerase/thioredoxin